MSTEPTRVSLSPMGWGWRLIHWLIILNLVLEIVYASAMVFFVIAPDGGGPLGARALDMPFEMMVTRRLYAVEAWIAIGALSIYLGLTEIAPRRRAAGSPSS